MSRDFSLQNASGQSGSPSSFEEDEGGSSLIQALPVILWERRWLLIIPAILGLIAGVGAAYTIPTMFESSATVLIESQQLPLDVVNSPVTDLIGQRIARALERHRGAHEDLHAHKIRTRRTGDGQRRFRVMGLHNDPQ